MDQKLLDKFLNHQATDQDIQALKGDPETAALVALSQEVAGLNFEGYKERENWHAINNHIKNKSEQSLKLQDNSFLGRLFRLSNTPEVIWRVAAVLIIALGTFYFLSPNNMNLVNPEGTHQSWTLPDGSEISLNAGSKANYDPESWNNNRLIELDGEAFFDVIKGSTFSVKTNTGVVTVLGTEFNVKVREGQFYVHCFEGLVKVQTSDTTLMLPAGSGMRLDRGLLQQDRVPIGAKPDWMSGESSFDNMPLPAVLEELGRQYAVNISYNRENSSLVESEKFSGSFTHEDLKIALKSVCQPFGLDFELANNRVRLFKN